MLSCKRRNIVSRVKDANCCWLFEFLHIRTKFQLKASLVVTTTVERDRRGNRRDGKSTTGGGDIYLDRPDAKLFEILAQ